MMMSVPFPLPQQQQAQSSAIPDSTRSYRKKKREEKLVGQVLKRYTNNERHLRSVPNVEKIERGSTSNTMAIGIVPPVRKLMNNGVKSLATNIRGKSKLVYICKIRTNF